jgi:hypothetical protein
MDTESFYRRKNLAHASFFLLSAGAGALWPLPLIAVSNTGEFSWNSLFLGSGIGLFMGALIFPWIRNSPPAPKKAAALAFLTYILALPFFLIVSDYLQVQSNFAHDFLSAVLAWPRIALYCLLPQHSAVLFPLSVLTVYGLWLLFYQLNPNK